MNFTLYVKQSTVTHNHPLFRRLYKIVPVHFTYPHHDSLINLVRAALDTYHKEYPIGRVCGATALLSRDDCLMWDPVSASWCHYVPVETA